jgi:hypothetical protein
LIPQCQALPQGFINNLSQTAVLASGFLPRHLQDIIIKRQSGSHEHHDVTTQGDCQFPPDARCNSNTSCQLFGFQLNHKDCKENGIRCRGGIKVHRVQVLAVAPGPAKAPANTTLGSS